MDVLLTVIYSCMLGICCVAIIESFTGTSRHPSCKHPSVQHLSFHLSVLFLLLLVNTLGELFIASGAEIPLGMLLGLVLYYYAYAMMSTMPRNMLLSYSIALLGPLGIILVMFPFVSLSAADKLSLASPETRDPELFQLAFLTCAATTIIFLAFTGVYFVKTYRLQRRHRLKLMDSQSNIDKQSLDWLRIVLILWGTAWLLFATNNALWFLGWEQPWISPLLSIFEVITLLTFTHFALNQPQANIQPNAPPKQMKTSSSLDRSRIEKIADKLSYGMEIDALFKDNELSLRRLSDTINTSENHISETLSRFMETNYFKYVNGFRINKAKRQLTNTNNTITNIAFEIGFNSRSTFNSVFKQQVGQTPSAYRSQSSEQPS